MAETYEGVEPNPDYWDDIPDNVRDDIHERMNELGLNVVIQNYDTIAAALSQGSFTSTGEVFGEEFTIEFAAIFDFFLTNDARRMEAIGVWPAFEQLLQDYAQTRLDQVREIEEEQANNPNAWQDSLMQAFTKPGSPPFEPAFGFLNTQARLLEVLSGTLRKDTPPQPSLPWELRLGASRFSVPPINIDVSQSFRVGSLSGGALRQQSAPKFNSGHKETLISMTLYFPTHQSIWGIDNESGELNIDFNKDEDWIIDKFLSSLRGLITQFKYAPFLPIRNDYLNSAYGITGVVLHSMSIATVEEFPFVVAVNLQMLNFNHKVYLPMIEDFHQAIHWGRYRQYMGRAAMRMNEIASEGFLVETQREITIMEGEVPSTDIINAIEYERDANTIKTFTSPYQDFVSHGRKSWNDGRHLDIYFPSKTPARIFAPDLANFRQPGEDDTASDRDRNGWEQFLGYLGLDVDTNPDATYDHMAQNYSTEITANPTERQKLLEWLNWIGNVADTMNAEALEEYLARRFAEEAEAQNTTVGNLPQGVIDQIESQVRVAWFTYIFEGFKDTPFFQAYLRNADYNTGQVTIKEWEVPMEPLNIDRNNVIITGVSVSMANNIARLQIQMQDEPTHQHIGGRDTRVDVSLTIFGEDDLARFQRLFKHINGLAQLEHAHGVLGFLGIKNIITALAGIKYVLPLSFEVDTVPGYPHVYNARLSFVDFDVFQQRREELSSTQQEELVEAFSKRNPFLRIKQLWGSFNAYPDFPLSVRDDETGDLIGHLDPDYFYRAYQMIDDDVVNWDLPPATTHAQQLETYGGSADTGTGGDLGSAIAEGLSALELDENGVPIQPAESPPTDTEGEYWTAGNRYPAGYPVDYDSTGGRLDEALRSRGYQHGVNHYLGLFNEGQSEASILRIQADGFQLGTQELGAPGSGQHSQSVQWITGNGLEQDGDAVKYQIIEDTAASVHNEPFVPLNTSVSDYGSPNADGSGNPYKQFELMMRDAQYRDISGRMIRAFPTYMLWLIDEGGNFAGVKLFDNFYGLQSVIDMSIHRSEDVLGDTLTLRLSNLYQKLTTNYKGYISDGDPNTQIIDLFIDRNRNLVSGTTDAIVALETIRLKPGVRAHLRMGYSSNPNALETVFNGTITEVKQGDIVEIIAQSDAIELSPYVNSTNKDGHSGKIDGGFNTGLWLSEPRDLMVRLLSMGSSTFKEAAAFASQGMIFSENRFGIRHFGSMLYPPLTDEEDQKNRNIREAVGALLSQASQTDSAGDAVSTVTEGVVEQASTGAEPEAFDASLGGFGVRSPVLGVAQQMWQNMFAQRDYELFKRNIYPGNGLGVAQYLGGDLLDGGLIWAESVSGSEANVAEIADAPAFGPTGAQQDIIDAEAITDMNSVSPDDSAGADEQLDAAFSEGGGLGGPAGTLVDLWDSPVNPFNTATTMFNTGRGVLGFGPYRNHPLLKMFGAVPGGEGDTDLSGFDEVSFRAQTYMKSVWDLFQLCAALLPNYIVAVRPFEDRSTIFYGKPHWLYTSGVIPLTTGIPNPADLEIDSVLGQMSTLQREAANAANPLADLENQLRFFKGLGERVDPSSSTAGLEFNGDETDVMSLSLQHPSGAEIPVRSGTGALEQHLPTREGTAHIELPDLNPAYSFANGYHSQGGSSGYGAFGPLEPAEEQFYMNMRWPYSNWAAGPHGSDADPYIPGQNPAIYKGLRIMVYCNDTGLACICTPGDAGPDDSQGHVAGMSPDVHHVLGSVHGSSFTFGFAPDGTPLGPVSSISTTPAGGGSNEEAPTGGPLLPEYIPQTEIEVRDLTSITSLDSIEYVDPISDRDIDDETFWLSLDLTDEERALAGSSDSLTAQSEIYAAAGYGRDSDTLMERILSKGQGDERVVAFNYGWLIDQIPVWVDPQSGGTEVGSVLVDQTGITARRIYDGSYNALFVNNEVSITGNAETDEAVADIIGSNSNGVEIFDGQNNRSLEDAEEIWDEIRQNFWTEEWVREGWDAVYQERHGNLDYDEKQFYQAIERWLSFLWQNPGARAWVVLTADRQSDWTSSSIANIVTLGVGGDIDNAFSDGIDVGDFNPGAWIHGSGNEGWSLNSSPFGDAWLQFLYVDDGTRVDPATDARPAWEGEMFNWMVENFSAGSDSQTAEEQAIDAARGLYDATIGKLVTAAALTMTGLVALYRLGLQQLGQGLDMVADMQRQANILNRVFNDSIYYAAGEAGSILRLADNPFTREYNEPVVEIREPFQRMHFLSSFQHIISNNVTETINDVATVVTASSDGKYPVTVYFDKGAPSERQVEKAVETGLFWDNAKGSGFFGFLHPLFHPIETARGVVKSATGSSDELLSKRVGLYHLKEGLKDIYGGEILVLGNPGIRPFDLVYLADVYERMYGMFEVEAVTHHFTPESGFVTAITPNAIVTINDPARWSVISWAWSWWGVKNTRDDLRHIMGIKADASAQISDEGVTTPELADALDTQLRGQVQYTHGGSALVRDIMATRGSGMLLSTNEALGAIDNSITGTQQLGLAAGIFNPLGSALLWPAWNWVKDNLLDQHGCYIQYLTKDGKPMDAGLSYAQGVSVGRHHSTNLLPGILGLRVDNLSEDGHRRITTDDLLASLGWQEMEVLELQRDLSWWINRTNARILEISGDGPDPVGIGDAKVEMVRIATIGYEDFDRDGIIDGDTVILVDGRRVRLAGVNTAELQFKHNLEYNSETDRARLATEYLRSILIDEPQSQGHPPEVAIRINTAEGDGGLDEYGRIIATIFHRVPIGVSVESRKKTLLSYAGGKSAGIPRQPFISWDQYMEDGRPYTANWDLVTSGLADIDLRGVNRNDPDRGGFALGN